MEATNILAKKKRPRLVGKRKAKVETRRGGLRLLKGGVSLCRREIEACLGKQSHFGRKEQIGASSGDSQEKENDKNNQAR